MSIGLMVVMGCALAASSAAAAPGLGKKKPTNVERKDEATVIKLGGKSGIDPSLADIAASVSVKESDLGQQVSFSAAALQSGQSYMKLVDPQTVDPRGSIDFAAATQYGVGFGTAIAAFTAVELHFPAKANNRYVVDCDASTSANKREWILGSASIIPWPIATSAEARPTFLYTAAKDGEAAIHVTQRNGDYSIEKCTVTPLQ
ncbi:MAG: hypothetical protein KC457_12005 [Myxococcales bacterium]|nr:hypothetical protein [Myxococcales bacterium]